MHQSGIAYFAYDLNDNGFKLIIFVLEFKYFWNN